MQTCTTQRHQSCSPVKWLPRWRKSPSEIKIWSTLQAFTALDKHIWRPFWNKIVHTDRKKGKRRNGETSRRLNIDETLCKRETLLSYCRKAKSGFNLQKPLEHTAHLKYLSQILFLRTDAAYAFDETCSITCRQHRRPARKQTKTQVAGFRQYFSTGIRTNLYKLSVPLKVIPVNYFRPEPAGARNQAPASLFSNSEQFGTSHSQLV